jgi:hypothetical protein
MIQHSYSASRPRWTITALTLPQREAYLRRMIESVNASPPPGGAEILVVYNTRPNENAFDVEARISSYSKHLPINVHINSREPTIAAGRNLQLTLSKSPLICFIDDDITIHGNVFSALEQTLLTSPVGLVGLPSFQGDTDTPVKPRPSSPHVDYEGLRYMQVQGMLAAGYRDLFLDIGGFNPRRQFWGEWTEFNLRLWRNGIPTAYKMDAGYLRHWEDAPESPTRNLEGREAHVLWGLICTALEYDAVDSTEATASFWHLVEQRYLAYSFGDSLSFQQLLRTTLELMPRITAEWAQISAFKQIVEKHPFPFMPFHPLSRADVIRVRDYASRALRPYRSAVWNRKDGVRPATVRGPFRKMARALYKKVGKTFLGDMTTPKGITSVDPRQSMLQF